MKNILVLRLLGLLRTRVIMACIGLFVMHEQPCISEWVVAVIALSLGVSAIEAWKSPNGDTHVRLNPSKDEDK